MIPPQYIASEALVERSIISEGAEIYGEVHNSIIGPGVLISEGCVVRDSIIMKGTEVGRDTKINKAIIAENCVIGHDCELGVGEDLPNEWKPDIYNGELVTIGENSVIPNRVKIGKNVAISGGTTLDDYPHGLLESGQNIIKVGDGR